MRNFGMGTIYAVPSGATQTPVPIAILKDCTVGFKVAKKFLSGQWKVPIDAGEGQVDITLKIKSADFRAATMAMLLAGTTTTANSTTLAVMGEAWAIPTTPYQVTVAQSATWTEDGGVLDITSGLWKTRVASAPAAGQYSVAAGVYTFAAADVAHNVSIVYSYTSTTAGSKLVYAAQTMNQSVGYAVRVYDTFNVGGVVKPIGFSFPNVHFDNLSYALKAEDWVEQDLSGRAIQDSASTTIFTEYVGE